MAGTMNMSQYARHRKVKGLRGQTRQAVRRALKDGRIRYEANGLIDPEVADAMWSDRTKGPPRKPVPEGLVEAGAAARTAKADLERARADMAQLDLRKARGSLMERDVVEAAVADAFKAIQSTALRWPARLATKLAGAKGRDAVRRIMAVEVDSMLRDLEKKIRGLE